MSWAMFEPWSAISNQEEDVIMSNRRLHRHHQSRSSQKLRCLCHRYWSPIILGIVLATPGVLLLCTSPIARYIRTTCFALIATGVCFFLMGLVWASLEASRFRKRRLANHRQRQARDRRATTSTGGQTNVSFIDVPPMPPSYFEVIMYDQLSDQLNQSSHSTLSPPSTITVTTALGSLQNSRSMTVIAHLNQVENPNQEVDVGPSEPPPPYEEAVIPMDQPYPPSRRYSV